jgi:hypothetical protein
MYISYFFAYHFGNFSAALDFTYPSWLFLLATVLIHVPCQVSPAGPISLNVETHEQSFYAQKAYTLSGQKRILGLVFFVLM